MISIFALLKVTSPPCFPGSPIIFGVKYRFLLCRYGAKTETINCDSVLPSTIIIDEPELGLHPEAINTLSDVMMTFSEQNQIIAATQSATLIDYFEPEDIIVVKREDGASTFNRLKAEDFNVWLEEYTLGQLWRKNIVEGGTQHARY